MNLPVLHRALADLETVPGEPAESTIHYEVLDASRGALLRWGSTTSLDTIVESATQARADLAGRPIHVRQLPEPSWAASAKWPQSTTAVEPHVRANRVSAAARDLLRAVEEARAADVPRHRLREAVNPEVVAVTAQLACRCQDETDPYAAPPTWDPAYPDNLDRAAHAAEALGHYARATLQLDDGTDSYTEQVEKIAADLVSDLMHLLDHLGANSPATIERGIGHHDFETREEADTAATRESAA